MIQSELDYLKRAVEALESGELTPISQRKVLRVISQISAKAAQRIEQEFQDRVDQNIANNNLVDILKS